MAEKKQRPEKNGARKKSKHKLKKGRHVVGLQAAQVLLNHYPERVQVLFIQCEKMNPRLEACLSLAENFGVAIQKVDKRVLDGMTSTQHQGIILQCSPVPVKDDNDLISAAESASKNAKLLILDGVTDPQNLGALFRIADGAGAMGIVITRHHAPPLGDVVSKVSQGAIDTVPCFQVANLSRAMTALKRTGFWITGTALDESAQSLFESELTGRRGIVLGAEGAGLSRSILEACDEIVYIPMSGKLQSMNVAQAAAVSLFEAVRQGLQ